MVLCLFAGAVCAANLFGFRPETLENPELARPAFKEQID